MQSQYSNLRNPHEVALQFDISTRTLDNWRCRGIGPDYVKIGRKVFYTDEACKRFIERQTVTTQLLVEGS